MNPASLFLSAKGRITQPTYWAGFLVLSLVSLGVLFIPVIGFWLWLATVFSWTQLTTKRLHDFNRSGWTQLVCYAVNLGLFVVGLVLIGGATFVTLFQKNVVQATLDAGFAAGFTGAFLISGGVLMFNAVWLIWLGGTPGTPDRNRYGAAPPRNAVRAAK